MRKITVLEHITLDGVIQAGGGPDEDNDPVRKASQTLIREGVMTIK
jgi:hypothetical protein